MRLKMYRGYWRNSGATKPTLTADGWINAGDVAYVDDDNMFYIVDRKTVRNHAR